MQFRPPQEPEYTQPQTYYPPLQMPTPGMGPYPPQYPPPGQYYPGPFPYPPPGNWPPPQGYLPGPVPPQSRPVNTNMKIAAISVFGAGMLIALLGGLTAEPLAGICGLVSFILMFFI